MQMLYVEFVDKVQGGSAAATGKVDNIGNTEVNRIQVLTGLTPAETAETGTHEIGHTGGLRHETDPANPPNVLKSMQPNNIMNAVNFGNTQSTSEQIKEIDKNIPDQNKAVEVIKVNIPKIEPAAADATRVAQ